MSDHRLESTSALLDNDVADAQQLQQQLDVLLTDPQAQQSWQRYALIGHIMRGDAQSSHRIDISLAIQAQLANEAAPTQSNVVRGQFGQTLAKASERWWKPLGGIAIAASVALVAVLSVQQPLAPDAGVAEASSSPAFVTNPFGDRNPVSFNTVVMDNNPSEAEVAQQRALLQSYMLDHQQQLQLSLQQQQLEQQQEPQQKEATINPDE
ncbi:MAG: Anti-sigma-E factor RseA [Pseudidiomarina mangrovi]|nr:MAG: Anti-sigma-E factor RseA [Pseudidiomarina mangrovi]